MHAGDFWSLAWKLLSSNYLIDGPVGPVIQLTHKAPYGGLSPLSSSILGWRGPANKPAYNRTEHSAQSPPQSGSGRTADVRFESKENFSTAGTPRPTKSPLPARSGRRENFRTSLVEKRLSNSVRRHPALPNDLWKNQDLLAAQALTQLRPRNRQAHAHQGVSQSKLLVW